MDIIESAWSHSWETADLRWEGFPDGSTAHNVSVQSLSTPLWKPTKKQEKDAAAAASKITQMPHTWLVTSAGWWLHSLAMVSFFLLEKIPLFSTFKITQTSAPGN